jgi:YfiH family protein
VTSPSAATAPVTREAASVLSRAGLDITRLAYARQVHGAEAARVGPAGGFSGTVDILVTTERAVPLAVFTADCLAITLYDPEARALAVAHVGWRGAARGGAAAAVGAITAAGARPERVRAAIAPSIGPCCYEVDAPVVEALAAAYPDRWRRWTTPSRPERVMLDLWTANEEVLEAAGLARDHIENPRLCTACHPDLLYSYRKGNHGRLVTVAALP